MPRVQKFNSALSVLLTSLFVAISYEIKTLTTTPIPQWVFVVISIVVGLNLSPMLIDGALKLQIVRRRLLGPTWLEGVWITKAFQNGQLVRNAVTQISYHGRDLDLQVTVYTPLDTPEEGSMFSVSQMTAIREPDLLYFNYFVSAADPGDRLGVGIGNFYRDHGAAYPVRYQGKIFYLDRSPTKREIAEKLDKETVRSYRKQYKREWLARLVQDFSTSLPPENATAIPVDLEQPVVRLEAADTELTHEQLR